MSYVFNINNTKKALDDLISERKTLEGYRNTPAEKMAIKRVAKLDELIGKYTEASSLYEEALERYQNANNDYLRKLAQNLVIMAEKMFSETVESIKKESESTKINTDVLDKLILGSKKSKIEPKPIEVVDAKPVPEKKGLTKKATAIICSLVVAGSLLASSLIYVSSNSKVANNNSTPTPAISSTPVVVESGTYDYTEFNEVVTNNNKAYDTLYALFNANIELIGNDLEARIDATSQKLMKAYDEKNILTIKKCTAEFESYIEEINNLIKGKENDENEEELCIKLAHEYHERITANNNSQHVFPYPEMENVYDENGNLVTPSTLQIVKWIRKHYEDTDYNIIIDEVENYYNEANNTAAVAYYSNLKEFSPTNIRTDLLMIGKYTDKEIEAVKAFEGQTYDMYAVGYGNEKNITSEAATAYEHYFINFKENVITLRGTSHTLPGHDTLTGFSQKVILWNSVPLLWQNHKKLWERVYWMPEEVYNLGDNLGEFDSFCDEFYQSKHTEDDESYPIKAHTTFRDDILKVQRNVKNEDKGKSLSLTN